MQDAQSVSNITNILSTIIKNGEPTLQNVWVHGKVSPPLSDPGTLPGYFKLEDANNSGKFIECVIFEENAHILADLLVGDNVLVNGRISLHRANRSEYRFVIEDKQPLGDVPAPTSVGTLIDTLRNTISNHSVKVQGKIANNPNVGQGYCQLHLKNANNAEMIVCVLPPNIARPPFCLQRDTEVSIDGKFDIFILMSQYQIKIANPNDIQLAPSNLDGDGQTVVDAVHSYFDGFEIDEFLVERERKIQFGSRNGFVDVVLVDSKGSFAAIAECKWTNFVGDGIEQLKSYLCATDTRFGIFANRADPNEWKFYENRRGNCISEIDCSESEFKAQVVEWIANRERLKDEIETLKKAKDNLGDKKSELETEIAKLEQKEHELRDSREQRKEKIQQFETLFNDLKSDLLDSEPALLSDNSVDPQRTGTEKKLGIVSKLKNLFSKEKK